MASMSPQYRDLLQTIEFRQLFQLGEELRKGKERGNLASLINKSYDGQTLLGVAFANFVAGKTDADATKKIITVLKQHGAVFNPEERPTLQPQDYASTHPDQAAVEEMRAFLKSETRQAATSPATSSAVRA